MSGTSQMILFLVVFYVAFLAFAIPVAVFAGAAEPLIGGTIGMAIVAVIAAVFLWAERLEP